MSGTLAVRHRYADPEHTSLESSFIHSTNSAAATDVEVVLAASGLVEDLSLGLTWGLFDIVGGQERRLKDNLTNDQSDLFQRPAWATRSQS